MSEEERKKWGTTLKLSGRKEGRKEREGGNLTSNSRPVNVEANKLI